MRSINIGIVEIEQMERNTKRILAIIQKNNILKNIPHTLTLLRRSKLTADFMFYKYNLDIFIIERAMDISIFIRNLKTSTLHFGFHQHTFPRYLTTVHANPYCNANSRFVFSLTL